MIKTTTLYLSQSSSKTATPRAKKVQAKAAEFGPSELTIQNILNYSKALEVINTSGTETVFGVMN